MAMSVPEMGYAQLSQSRNQQWAAVESERRAAERDAIQMREANAAVQNAAFIALVADHCLGFLTPELLAAFPVKGPEDVTNAYNTAVTRLHVAKQRKGDMEREFLMRNLVHALAHPIAFRLSDKVVDCVVVIGYASDMDRMLSIPLEAPPAERPTQGGYGWRMKTVMPLGKRKWRQYQNGGHWVPVLRR